MIVEEFVNRLEGVTGHDGQYSARCPAHDDKNASLSVGKGDNGKILIHCHAGCSCAAILSAMGLTEADLFDDNRKFSRERKKGHREIVARYDYTDTQGRLLNQKTRWVEDGKKTFTWSHKENGHWVKGRTG